MNRQKRTTLMSVALFGAALWLLSSCNETNTADQAAGGSSGGSGGSASHSVLSGTRIDVTLGSDISSETANVGDAWHGTVTQSVSTQNGTIPAGSHVTGVVEAVTAAKRGSRAMLDLGIRGIQVNGHNEAIAARTDPVIAGSTRARNLGAIAGGAAAGALIGKVVGDGKNAAVGGLIGGAAATGVVAGSKGYQVRLASGTVMSFTVNQTVAMR